MQGMTALPEIIRYFGKLCFFQQVKKTWVEYHFSDYLFCTRYQKSSSMTLQRALTFASTLTAVVSPIM